MYSHDKPTHGVKFITNDPRHSYKPFKSVDSKEANDENKATQNKKNIEYNTRNGYMGYSFDDGNGKVLSKSILPSMRYKVKSVIGKEKPANTSRIISNFSEAAFNFPVEQYNSYAMKLPKLPQGNNIFRKRHKHIKALVSYRSNRGLQL